MVRVLKNKVKNIRNKNILLIFVGRFLKGGNRLTIFNIFKKSLLVVKKKKRKTNSYILNLVLNKIKPIIGLRPKFASGLIYMLPSFIHKEKETSMGLQWFLLAVKFKKGIPLLKNLIEEILLCYDNKGQALKFKRDFYKLIITNRVLLDRFKKRK